MGFPFPTCIFSVFGGLSAFGTWGAVIGPLVVRLAMEVLAISREEEVKAS